MRSKKDEARTLRPTEYNNLRRPVEYKRMFSPKELRDLKCYKKYRIAGTNYLVNTLDVTLRKNKIDPAKVSLFKV